MNKGLSQFLVLIILLGGSTSIFSQHQHQTQHRHTLHQGMFGPYAMNREASGTSWQPDSTPMVGLMASTPSWTLMTDGFLTLIYDNQGGPRGDDKTFSTSMLMLMGHTQFGNNTFGLRGMVSLDPLMGKRGYPLLLQVGETADGITPLIDRQHPHDFFMELAATYSYALSPKSAIYFYAGLPGEPALGPPTFMHRWSGREIVEAPILHHWLDSTHITFGVLTAGFSWDVLKIEGSLFNGHEPDQHRWGIESPRFNSHSMRVTYNFLENWSLQFSRAFLKAPEQIHPEVNIHRTTSSLIYNKPLPGGNNWQTTFAFGSNDNDPGHKLSGYLLESTIKLSKIQTYFGRIERVQEDELLELSVPEDDPLAQEVFTVNKLTVGYIYDFPKWECFQMGIGGLVSTYWLPDELEIFYGKKPFSYMIFVRGHMVS